VTPEQKEAVEWVKGARHAFYDDAGDDKRRATILAMLAEPRLPRPEDVPECVLEKIWWATAPRGNHFDVARAAYRALYDHYTAPRTKLAEKWHIEYVGDNTTECYVFVLPSKEAAEQKAKEMADKNYGRCIRVTGPHQQEVPDDAR